MNAYNETVATVEGTVLVRARKFRDLKVSDKELAPLQQIDDAVRQIQAPELVDDAVQVEPMVGPGTQARQQALPATEAAELVRGDPDLLSRGGPRPGHPHRPQLEDVLRQEQVSR